MKKISIALMAAFFLMSFSHSASAYNLFSSTDCTKASDSAVCATSTSNNKSPVFGPNGIFEKVTNIISYIAGGAAIILIIIGGFRFVVSAGDSGAVSGARNTIINTIIGLIVIVVGRVMIDFVLSNL